MMRATLDDLFLKHKTDKASSHHDYAPVYESLFGKDRDEPIVLLEIGVQFGHSVRAWLDYFTAAHIVGVDGVDAHGVLVPRFTFFCGDQRDSTLWASVVHEYPIVDVVIDDASHRADASRDSFNALWPRLRPGGVYIIEDVFTWWDDAFRSSLDGATWLADLCGAVSWHGKDYHGKPKPAAYELTDLERTLDYVRVSRGLVVLGKRR